ncbi:hypothetical protein LJC49_07955 [Ruminococcaceae bacterium OttesenSCG-928-I18]|nr:hypothetical protein [Ruminococcaceae bacterium OttesenSCG-928-I18]
MDFYGSIGVPGYAYGPTTGQIYGELGYRESARQADFAAEAGMQLLQDMQEAEENMQQVETDENRIYYRDLEDARQQRLEALHAQQAMRFLYPNYVDPAVYQAQLMWLINSL